MRRAPGLRSLLGLVLVALGATAFLVVPTLGPRDGFITAKAVALAAAGALAAALAAWRARGRSPLDRLELAALGYFAALLLAWAAQPGLHGFTAVGMAQQAAAVALFACARRAARRSSGRRALQLAVVGIAAALALVVLVEAAGVDLPWEGPRRPHATLGSRNAVAAYAAAAAPLAAASLFARPGLPRAAPLVLLTAAVVLTRCRSVWLGSLLVLSIAATLALVARARAGRASPPGPARAGRRDRGRAAGGLGLALAAGVALAATPSWPGLVWREARPLVSTARRLLEHDQGSGRARLEQHRLGFAALRERPLLGAGPRRWNDVAAGHARSVPGAHAAPWPWSQNLAPSSELVRLAVEGGALALVAALAAALFFVRGAMARVRRTVGVERSGRLAALLGLAGLAVHGLFDAPLSRPDLAVLVAVLAGLCAGSAAPTRVVLGPGPRRVLFGGGAACLALAAALQAGALAVAGAGFDTGDLARAQRWIARPDVAERLVQRLAQRGDCEAAGRTAEALLSGAPHGWGAMAVAAFCAEQAGDEEAARAWKERARALEPDLERFVTWRPLRVGPVPSPLP